MSSLSPDPTLTVENVTRAMEKVSVDKRRRVWETIFNHRQVVEEIYSSHSSEEEKLHSCADTYVTCKPDSSLEELVRQLYDRVEMAAAKEAKAFLQQKGGWFIEVVYLSSPCSRIVPILILWLWQNKVNPTVE
jgi:uncharacterized lipoprotein